MYMYMWDIRYTIYVIRYTLYVSNAMPKKVMQEEVAGMGESSLERRAETVIYG